ncbi:MAG: DUF302 domain-containing protein [Tenuifilaceae bacterium]|nr:DUF302 domain-containing protein [Bacteroidales bacterium]MDY0201677.1 DUF302 domain-containing protein [Tenuifilaceae bacterium]
MNYYFSKTIEAEFDKATELVIEALKAEGFGILTEINTQQVFKEKLNIDFKKYKILGACNPAIAHRALHHEDKIGTMLPCNVIVQEISKNKTEIAAINPVASMLAVKNENITAIANEVKEKLERVISSLK